MNRQRRVELTLRLYRRLAEAFPHEFKNVYGDELLEVTEDSIEYVWRRYGIRGLARLLLDIAIRLPAEHWAECKQDVRYGLRTLCSSPGFTAVALVSLSLGVCIATCALSQMNGMALRVLPAVQNPGELAALQSPVSYPDYRRIREQHDLFSSTMAYVAPAPFTVSVNGSQARNWGHLVTESYFSTLGVNPALGSFFHPEQEAQTPVVVVSHRLWRDRLGADLSAPGKTVRLNGHAVTIIGVAPDDFLGASPLLFPADLWMPLPAAGRIAPELAGNTLEQPETKMFFVVGRLKPGILLTQAEAELEAIAEQIEQERIGAGTASKGRRILLVEGGKLLPLRKQDIPFFTSFLSIVAALIMLIACANVANMMIARAARRRREIAVRLALGASRTRLIRQLLTESMMLSMAAGILGFFASTWLMTLGAQVQLPFPMPVAFDFRPDERVLMLTLALTLCTGVVFGLLPALQATRSDVAPALKAGGSLFLRSHRRWSFRSLLMVSQVAGSLTLLVVLGLLSMGIQTTLGIQTGFDSRDLYLVNLDPVRDGYSGERAAAFFEKLSDRLASVPSIRAAALTETVPVSMPGAAVTVATPSGVTVRAIRHVVGRGYFETTGISILHGRSFRQSDETALSPPVIVSQALALQLWTSGEPLGQLVEIRNDGIGPPKILPGSFDHRPTVARGGLTRFQVVGVAADVAEGLVVGKPRPALYFPLRRSSYAQPSLQGITIIVRAAPGADAVGAVRREISALDDRIMPFNARSMDDQIEHFMGWLRMAGWTYGLVGVFGLVLAAVGLAGVTAYSVAQRAREIGIRIALGATRQNVLSLVLKEGVILVLMGTVIGMCGAWAGARMLSAMNSTVGTVSSTTTNDPVVLIGAPMTLALLALFACYIPARKSTCIDPAVTLRQE